MNDEALPSAWLEYLAATGRTVEWHTTGCWLRLEHRSPAISPLYAHRAILLRVLYREARALLVADQVMEADLDFAETQGDFAYLKAMTGGVDSPWPTPAMGPAMAHHLHANLAAERHFSGPLLEQLPHAAKLFAETQKHGPDSGCLAHRWAERRACVSASLLDTFLSTLQPFVGQARPVRRRRSF
jgi:hypothetical protein